MDVILRPVAASDLAWLEPVGQDPELSGFNWFGPRPAGWATARFEDDGFLGHDRGNLVVEADGEPVGTVSWNPEHWGPAPYSRSFNIGITLRPDARGRGLGGRAQRLLAEHLFSTTTVNRIEASTDVENVAEQRALERAGFRREGIARGAQWRAGAFHDLVVYAIVRSDLPAT